MNKNRLVQIKTFHKNGNIDELYFKRSGGVYHGEYKSFYEDGTEKKRCFWVDGVRHGELIERVQDGTVLNHCFCSPREPWWENGALPDPNTYKNVKEFNIREVTVSTTPVKFFYLKEWREVALSEYAVDINNITDTEFKDLTFTFGDNFFEAQKRNA